MIAYSVILFSVASVFFAIGILLYRGKTGLIHDYHQTNVRESDKKEYGRAFAKAVFCIVLTLTVSGGIALLGENKAILYSSVAVLFSGLTVSVILIAKIQKKYNGGIF